MTMVNKKVLISGKVQGVSFRFHAHEEATKRNITGWVRNLTDGRVEMFLSGDEKEVQNMLKWVQKGPPAAKVDKVDVSDSKEAPAPGFFIKREGDK